MENDDTSNNNNNNKNKVKKLTSAIMCALENDLAKKKRNVKQLTK